MMREAKGPTTRGSRIILNAGDGARFGRVMPAQLLYVSRASPEFIRNVRSGAEDLRSLGVQAAANNGPLRVTGLLVYNAGNFMQLLEGDAFIITDLYATIARDARHRAVERLAFGPCRHRLFRDWSVGVCNPEMDMPCDRSRLEESVLDQRAPDATIADVAQHLLTKFRRCFTSSLLAA